MYIVCLTKSLCTTLLRLRKSTGTIFSLSICILSDFAAKINVSTPVAVLKNLLFWDNYIDLIQPLYFHWKSHIVDENIPSLMLCCCFFLFIKLLNELSQLSQLIYNLSPFPLITFWTLNSVWFVFCNFF